MTVLIRPYRTIDFDSMYALWQTALGTVWRLTPAYFQRMLIIEDGDLLIAEEAGRVIGCAAGGLHQSGKSSAIKLVMVSPDKQRQGVGTQLHTALMARLREQKPETIQLGYGGNERLGKVYRLTCPAQQNFSRLADGSLPTPVMISRGI